MTIDAKLPTESLDISTPPTPEWPALLAALHEKILNTGDSRLSLHVHYADTRDGNYSFDRVWISLSAVLERLTRDVRYTAKSLGEQAEGSDPRWIEFHARDLKNNLALALRVATELHARTEVAVQAKTERAEVVTQ